VMVIMEMRESRQGWNPIRAEGDDGNCSSRTPENGSESNQRVLACSVTVL